MHVQTDTPVLGELAMGMTAQSFQKGHIKLLHEHVPVLRR